MRRQRDELHLNVMPSCPSVHRLVMYNLEQSQEQLNSEKRY
jgi:hypothetical protein